MKKIYNKKLLFAIPVLLVVVALSVFAVSVFAQEPDTTTGRISNILQGSAQVAVPDTAVLLEWSTTSATDGFSNGNVNLSLQPNQTVDLWVKATKSADYDIAKVRYSASGIHGSVITVQYEDPVTPGSYLDLGWDDIRGVSFFGPAEGFTMTSAWNSPGVVTHLHVTANAVGSANVQVWAIQLP